MPEQEGPQIQVQVTDDLSVVFNHPLSQVLNVQLVIPTQMWEAIEDMRKKKALNVQPVTNVRDIQRVREGKLN